MVYATLQATPLASGGCGITGNGSSEVKISGNVSQECSFQIVMSDDSHVVLLDATGSVNGTNYLYLNINGDIFVAGADLQTSCNVQISQTFTLHILGSFTINLRQIAQSSTDVVLPDTGDAIQCVNPLYCCGFKEYSYIVSCKTESYNAVRCKFLEEYSEECTSELNDKEVISECRTGEPDTYERHSGFLASAPTQKCRELNLTGTNLTGLSRGAFQTIQSRFNCSYIDLRSNLLTDLSVGTFQGINGIASLSLDHNQLSTLRNGSFQGIEALYFLTLSSNRLASIETGVFQNFTQIKYINLNDNYLTTIGMGVFQGLHSLMQLHLASNHLRHMDLHLFRDLNNIVTLNMSRNRLDTIPKVGHMKMLTRLEVWENPLYLIQADVFDGLPKNLIAIVGQFEVCRCYMDINITNCHIINDVEQSSYLTCERLLADVALACFTWVIGFSALFGNMAVLVWRNLRKEQENRIQSILLRNLAMADFLMGLYMIIIASADASFSVYFPMQSEMWRSGAVCKLAGVFATTSSEASVFFITLISIDRFLCIMYPSPSTSFHTTKTWIVVCCTWLFALLLGIVSSVMSGKYPEFYDHSHLCIGLPLSLQNINKHGEYAETGNKTIYGSFKQTFVDQEITVGLTTKPAEEFQPAMYFSIGVFLVLNSICLVIIVICYLVIIRIVRQSQKRINKGHMARQVRLTIKVAIIVATDFCSWLPIILIGILVQSKAIPPESIPPRAYAWIITFVLPINSAMNPFLYTLATAINASNRASRHTSDKHEIQALTNKAEQGTKATSNTIL